MTGNIGDQATLRQRFLAAVRAGQLGTQSHLGVVVTVKAFKAFFSDIDRNYASSFLASAAIETGRSQMTDTKYVMRLRKGLYRVHPEFIRGEASEGI